ncbi:VOC family protein [Nocardiopsis sp. LOL_012]|uniref:VOC family protein n=1 Tax=Nocardiopsis sp. LOL_012 TaxID=3345409 RepID=UPI003A855B50
MVTITGITPFLWFDDQAEEAARLYTGLFDGSRILGSEQERNGESRRLSHLLTPVAGHATLSA